MDFIRYSISDNSIERFISKLNCLDVLNISKKGSITELNQQDYKGKRIFLKVEDNDNSLKTVSSMEDMIKRIERVFNNKEYIKKLEKSEKNWLDIPIYDVLEKDVEFLKEIQET